MSLSLSRYGYSDVATVGVRFSDFGLNAELLAGIDEMKWPVPSPIQAKIIPMVIAGNNIVARAKNGTGKTGAYVIPVLQSIDETKQYTQAVILVTSRELAMQVHGVVMRIAKFMNLTAMYNVAIPDVPVIPSALRETQILIATAGRLETLIGVNAVRLSKCKIIVMDEADWLIKNDLKYGHITNIISTMPEKPQMVLMSTSFPPECEQVMLNYAPCSQYVNLVNESLNMNLMFVANMYRNVGENDKFDCLLDILEQVPFNRMIVFCRTTSRVDRICRNLYELGYACMATTAQMGEQFRDEVYHNFCKGFGNIMVASEVFSRGIDVPSVDVVVNYDLPWKPTTYLHRAGRTGRFGTKGRVISFIAPGDKNTMINIAEVLQLEIVATVEPDSSDSEWEYELELVQQLEQQPEPQPQPEPENDIEQPQPTEPVE